jgi:hypothetical protein
MSDDKFQKSVQNLHWGANDDLRQEKHKSDRKSSAFDQTEGRDSQ